MKTRATDARTVPPAKLTGAQPHLEASVRRLSSSIASQLEQAKSSGAGQAKISVDLPAGSDRTAARALSQALGGLDLEAIDISRIAVSTVRPEEDFSTVTHRVELDLSFQRTGLEQKGGPTLTASTRRLAEALQDAAGQARQRGGERFSVAAEVPAGLDGFARQALTRTIARALGEGYLVTGASIQPARSKEDLSAITHRVALELSTDGGR
jgi:hypothetical protein